MKRIVWGIVVGGAAAAAFAGSAAANADPASWTADYDVDKAQWYAGQGPLVYGWKSAWEMPASFTHGTGTDATTLTGTDYLTQSLGALNNEFVTSSGAIYDQEQFGGGFTNLYYDPVHGTATDVMNTPFGNIDLSSMASTFAPNDWGLSTAATVGENVVVTDDATSQIWSALGLYNNNVGWLGGLTGDSSTITSLQGTDSQLVWAAPASYSDGIGEGATTLTGQLYVTAPLDVAFVDKAGDVFSQDNLVSTPLLVVDNVYYDPAGGTAQDYLSTDFGLINISPLAFLFAPDVSDLVTPTPTADLTDAGLFSALDLGLPS